MREIIETIFRKRVAENKKLIIILILIGVLLLSIGSTKNFTWDEAHHANVALFYKNFA